jgi:hypothetical protein
VPNEQHRFKNPFARIRLFQILIPQLRFGDFFNTAKTPMAQRAKSNKIISSIILSPPDRAPPKSGTPAVNLYHVPFNAWRLKKRL